MSTSLEEVWWWGREVPQRRTIPTPQALVGLPVEIDVRELLSRLAVAVGGQLADELYAIAQATGSSEPDVPIRSAVSALDDLVDVWSETVPPPEPAESEF